MARTYRKGSDSLSHDIRIRIPAKLAAQLDETAKKKGITKAELARKILESYFSHDKSQSPNEFDWRNKK